MAHQGARIANGLYDSNKTKDGGYTSNNLHGPVLPRGREWVQWFHISVSLGFIGWPERPTLSGEAGINWAVGNGRQMSGVSTVSQSIGLLETQIAHSLPLH